MLVFGGSKHLLFTLFAASYYRIIHVDTVREYPESVNLIIDYDTNREVSQDMLIS